MRLTRISLPLGLSITAAALLACRQSTFVEPANPAPQAVAKADAAEYPNAPATVTLDATGSTDDGAIVAYQWLSATGQPDDEAGRLVPEGQSVDWPTDEPTVSVQLPEGIWTFGLWVTDDLGVTGAPAYVTVIVGDPPRPEAGAGGAGPAGGAGGG
jgi:hypothetical protein